MTQLTNLASIFEPEEDHNPLVLYHDKELNNMYKDHLEGQNEKNLKSKLQHFKTLPHVDKAAIVNDVLNNENYNPQNKIIR